MYITIKLEREDKLRRGRVEGEEGRMVEPKPDKVETLKMDTYLKVI